MAKLDFERFPAGKLPARADTDLVPTQMTVGMQEVEYKRRRWRERSAHEAANFLNKLRIPVVLGPGARPYLLDRHHLAFALHNEGVKELFVSIQKRWTACKMIPFARCHGRSRRLAVMPRTKRLSVSFAGPIFFEVASHLSSSRAISLML
jgi:hypothetical protein